MAPTSPWHDYIRSRVEEGPVQYDQLVMEAAGLVPPGRAFRTAFAKVEHAREKVASGLVRHYKDEETRKSLRVRYGQRAMVMNTINHLAKVGRIEVRENGSGKIVKIGSHPWSDPLPTRATNETTALVLYAVEDGPIGFEQLFDQLLDSFPRERAIEKAIRQREASRANHKPKTGRRLKPESRRVISDDENFRSGARALYTATLKPLVKSQRILVTGQGADRVISRGPRWVAPEL